MARVSSVLVWGTEVTLGSPEAFGEVMRIVKNIGLEQADDHNAHVISAYEAMERPWDCGYVGISVGLMSAMDRYREATGVGIPVSARAAD
jgi:hypothetical protein